MTSRILLLMLALLTTPVRAQVTIVDHTPDPIVIEETLPTKSALLTPVPGKRYKISSMVVEGAVGIASGSTVRIRFGNDERFIVAGRNGRFHTTIELQKIGTNHVTVELPDTTFVVPILHIPHIRSLILSAPRQTLKPGGTVSVTATATREDGATEVLDPELVTWRSQNNAIGQIDAVGRLSAISQGTATIIGTYGGRTRARLKFTVVHPDPPRPTGGLSNIVTRSSRITVKIWDHGDEDGDIVSIYVNGQAVAEFVEIFHTPKTFKFTIQPGDNRIVFRAENEGLQSPNTGSIAIHPEGERATNQEFSVPQKTSGEFTITLRQ